MVALPEFLRRIKRRICARPKVHANVMAEAHVSLDGCTMIGPIEIGFRSYANDSLIRSASIGRFCSIGRRCSIGAARHSMVAFTSHSFAAPAGFDSDPLTVIGHDVWIGDNVIVVTGLTIGTGAVVGAGAVVTRDVAPYSIVVGMPAHELRRRFSADIAERLIASKWWEYGDAALGLGGSGADPLRLLDALTHANLMPLVAHHEKFSSL